MKTYRVTAISDLTGSPLMSYDVPIYDTVSDGNVIDYILDAIGLSIQNVSWTVKDITNDLVSITEVK